MYKILIVGAGAQGATVAQRMDEESGVGEIICADTDEAALEKLTGMLGKARGLRLDASDTEGIVRAAAGADLIVDALPIRFSPYVMEAAIRAGTNYQNFASTDVLDPYWPKNIEIMRTEYGRRFSEIGRLAVIGTGSAPGFMCVTARDAMRYLDTCDDILMMVYEGVEAKRFLPFWWSPYTALSDMADATYAVKGGELVESEPHSLPVTRHFKGCSRPVTLVEHAHDEPVFMSFNRETHFKGAKNINFKYGGVGIEFSTPLYRAGLLSKKEETHGGHTFVPFDVILSHIPPAPRFPQEIKEIIDEGLVRDEGAFVVEATGIKDGKRVLVETYVNAPGLLESYDRAHLSAEQYMTGQCGALFTRMFVRGGYTQTGLITSDMLTFPEVDMILRDADSLGVTLDTEVREL